MEKKFNIREFYIAITNRCNLACMMCTTGKGKHDAKNELTAEEWKATVAHLIRDCEVQRITFGGGEPLLRDDLADIIKFTCAAGVEGVNIISNGILLGEKFMARFNEAELKKLGINISMDGLEYDHDYIRGHGAFARTIKNVDMLYHGFLKRKKIKDLVISSTLMPENFARYIDFLEFIKKYEGMRIDIQPVIPNNEICYQRGEFKLTGPEKDTLHKIIDYLTDNIAISTRSAEVIRSYIRYFDNNLAKSGRCSTGYETLNITYDGYPYLCGKLIMMPLNKIAFKDVFYSPEYQSELERIKACRQPCLQGLHLNPEEEFKE